MSRKTIAISLIIISLIASAELEDREYQATLHVRDSVQLVENALLEKEQVCS